MRLDEIIGLATANVATTALAATALVTLFLLALAVAGVNLRPPWRRRMSTIELRFCNVFAMMGEKRREELIASYAKKYRCGRKEAMKHALEERDRYARSWR